MHYFCRVLNGTEPTDDTVIKVIHKGSQIVSYFYYSTNKMNELRKEFEKRNYNFTTLSQDVVTRWNSTFKMLSRLKEALEAVNVVLMKTPNGRDLVFTPSEQVVLSEILKCL